MALAPALGSQMQDRRFSRFTELSGTAMMHTLGAGAQGAAYAAAQRLGASHALVPPSLSDGGRRSMGKKGGRRLHLTVATTKIRAPRDQKRPT